jgi:uncharacterized protein (TIGR02145 family)
MNQFKTLTFLSLTVIVFILTSCDPVKISNNLPVVTTNEPIAVMANKATSGGVITSNGGSTVTVSGICWSTSSTPTIVDFHTNDSIRIGTFTSYMKDLIPLTTYFVRAYATNANGTSYGSIYKVITGTTVSDIDGNVYHTVTIGTQTWMVENLKTTKYRNGDLIGTTSPATKDISTEINPKYQWAYNGDENNVAKYGRLYTWYAVSDSRNITPLGWHVPSDIEFSTLENYVSYNFGTSLSTAKALSSNTDWANNPILSTISNNQLINNYSGYSALPGGYRENDARFGDIGLDGYWWSNTELDPTIVWVRYLFYNFFRFVRNGSTKSNGFSVRCVRDSQ